MKQGHETRLKYLYSATPLYNREYMNIIRSLAAYQASDVAQLRKKVLEFCEVHGVMATLDAYGISRPTLYRWKQVYEQSQKRLSSLVPQSRKPKRLRTMRTDPRIISFLKAYREQHPRLGKEKLKPFLDEYCRSKSIMPVAVSTIGKILKRHGYFKEKNTQRIYHNPASGHAKRDINYKTKVKHSPKETDAGYLEMDTIEYMIDGVKYYLYSAIDVANRFLFAYTYTRKTSTNATDFMKKVQQVYPMNNTIHTIQTDNGGEFLDRFDDYLKQQTITHLFSYPRCPKINGYIERVNRTLQEEFIHANFHLAMTNLHRFNRALMEYLLWYNLERPHRSLNNLSPINFLLSKLPLLSHMYVTHTITWKQALNKVKLAFNRRNGEEETRLSAKQLCAGSIPACASS